MVIAIFSRFSEAALEHLLLELREEDAVFGPPQAGGPPCVHEDTLFVEGSPVARFEMFQSSVDRFLTWGAVFTVFAQKPTKKSTRCAAYLATVCVLKTDVLKPPRGFDKVAMFVK